MAKDKRVRDVMSHIEEYDLIDKDARLCDALGILRDNQNKVHSESHSKHHTTLFVTGRRGKIVGKLSMYDIIRGLVPESAKEPEHSKSFYRTIDSRAAHRLQRRQQYVSTPVDDKATFARPSAYTRSPTKVKRESSR